MYIPQWTSSAVTVTRAKDFFSSNAKLEGPAGLSFSQVYNTFLGITCIGNLAAFTAILF
jgi:hypothetical protein